MISSFLPVFAIAGFFATVGCAPLPQTNTQEAPAWRIATWNLEHLAEADGTGCRPRQEADYADLRRHAATLDADVIAFQEVESKAAAERVFDPAKYDIVISGRPQTARGGTCHGAAGQSIRHQDVGFAIRKGLRWTRNPDVSDLGLRNPDLRWGVDVTLEGRYPLRLLAVHLKSGCNSGRSETDPDCPILFSQLSVLERWVDSRGAGREPFAILGDWNRRLSSKGDQFFGTLDRPQLAWGDLSLTDPGTGATCDPRFQEFIDHIVVSPAVAGRVVAASFSEYKYPGTGARHPSDHCPVSVLVKR